MLFPYVGYAESKWFPKLCSRVRRDSGLMTCAEKCIQGLVDSGLLYKVLRVSKPALPLSMYDELNIFKFYALDVGLLGAMANTDSSQILIKSDLSAEFNGDIFFSRLSSSLGFSPTPFSRPIFRIVI